MRPRAKKHPSIEFFLALPGQIPDIPVGVVNDESGLLVEMDKHDGKTNGRIQGPGVFKQGRRQQLPVQPGGFPVRPEFKAYLEERNEGFQRFNPAGTIFGIEFQIENGLGNPLKVRLRAIQVLQEVIKFSPLVIWSY